VTPSLTTSSRSVALARALGVLWSLLTLAVVWPLAMGVSRMFHDHGYGRGGVLTVLVVITTSAAVSFIVQLGTDALITDHRRRLRDSLATYLERYVPEHQRAQGQLLWAVDRAGEAESFEALRSATGLSVLAIPLIFVTGGWICVLIVSALLTLSIPFYKSAGVAAAAADERFQSQRRQLENQQLELLLHGQELRALGGAEAGIAQIAALSRREHHDAIAAIRVALRSSLVTEFVGGVSVGLVAMVVGFGLLHGRVTLTHALIAVFATSEFVGWIRRFGVAFHQREAITLATAQLTTSTSYAQAPSTHLLDAFDVTTSASGIPQSLRLDAGDHIALIGPSGIGKSTLVHTLMGWLAPVSGTVLRGSSPIAHVAVHSALLEGTLRTNLALDCTIKDEVLERIMTSVHLTMSLDTAVSPNGDGLSTGERVRLVIARGLACGAALFILDDVAGVLDPTSRAAVRDAILASGAATLECAPDDDLIVTPTRTLVLS